MSRNITGLAISSGRKQFIVYLHFKDIIELRVYGKTVNKQKIGCDRISDGWPVVAYTCKDWG